MPFSEEFNTSPAWEHTGEAALEEPQPQPIVEGYRGKVVIVTGGATGLGRSIAMEFGRRGCKVAFCYLDLPGRDVSEQALLTETTLSGMGVHVYACRCDVRDRLAVEHFVNETIARLGGLHYVVNNAGIAVDGALWRLTERAWSEVLETNVTGAFNCIRASAPHLRAQHYGKVVSVSAHTAGRPGFGVANYAASNRARIHPHRADGAASQGRGRALPGEVGARPPGGPRGHRPGDRVSLFRGGAAHHRADPGGGRGDVVGVGPVGGF
jgi:hypothetical protein